MTTTRPSYSPSSGDRTSELFNKIEEFFTFDDASNTETKDISDAWNDFVEVIADTLDLDLKTDISSGRKFIDFPGLNDITKATALPGTGISFATVAAGALVIPAYLAYLIIDADDIPIVEILTFISVWLWTPDFLKFNIGVAFGGHFSWRISVPAIIFALLMMIDEHPALPFTYLLDPIKVSNGYFSDRSSGADYCDLVLDFSILYWFLKIGLKYGKALGVLLLGWKKSEMLKTKLFWIMDRLKPSSDEREFDDETMTSLWEELENVDTDVKTHVTDQIDSLYDRLKPSRHF
jgi:hypothetical protein